MASGTLSRVGNGEVMHRRRHPEQNPIVFLVTCPLSNADEFDMLDGCLLWVNQARPWVFHFSGLVEEVLS